MHQMSKNISSFAEMEQMFGGGGGSVSQTPALELPPREPVENIATPPTPVYVANFNYTAEDDDEVSFSKGQLKHAK